MRAGARLRGAGGAGRGEAGGGPLGKGSSRPAEFPGEEGGGAGAVRRVLRWAGSLPEVRPVPPGTLIALSPPPAPPPPAGLIPLPPDAPVPQR